MSQKRIRLRPTAAPVHILKYRLPSDGDARNAARNCLNLTSFLPLPQCLPKLLEMLTLMLAILMSPMWNQLQNTRSYLTRQQRLSEAWSDIRGKLRSAVIESSVIYDKCDCFLCCKPAHILCKQCGPHPTCILLPAVCWVSAFKVPAIYFTVQLSGRYT